MWAVAVTRDGSRIASAGEDSVVRIWRVADGTTKRLLRGHQRNVWSIAFTPDEAAIGQIA